MHSDVHLLVSYLVKVSGELVHSSVQCTYSCNINLSIMNLKIQLLKEGCREWDD